MFQAVPPLVDNITQKFRPEPAKPKIKPFPKRNIENLKHEVQVETIAEAKSALIEDERLQTTKQIGQAFRAEPERENIIQYEKFSNLKTQTENDFINQDIKTILQVNDLLKSGNFVMAEHYLQRELTPDEKVNRSISGPIMRYQKPYIPTKWADLPSDDISKPEKGKVTVTTDGGTKVTLPTTIDAGVGTDGYEELASEVEASLNKVKGATKFNKLNKSQLLAYAYVHNLVDLTEDNKTIKQLTKLIKKHHKGSSGGDDDEKEFSGVSKLYEDEPITPPSLKGSGFATLGNFKINMKTLDKPNPKLSVYYNKSGKRVVYFHPMPSVSKTFANALKQQVGKGWSDAWIGNWKKGSGLGKLNPNEEELWNKLMVRARGGGPIRKRAMTSRPSAPGQVPTRSRNLPSIPKFAVNVTNKPKRLTILLGEIDARGSDKQATAGLVKEAISIAKELLSQGTLNKSEYQEIIESIN